MSGGSIRSKLMSPRGEFKKRSTSFRYPRKTKSASRRNTASVSGVAPTDHPTHLEVVNKFMDDNPNMGKKDLLDAILSDRLFAGSQESGDDGPFPGIPLHGAGLVSSTRSAPVLETGAQWIGSQSMYAAGTGIVRKSVEKNWKHRPPSCLVPVSGKEEEAPVPKFQGIPERPPRPVRPEGSIRKTMYPTLGKFSGQAMDKMLEIAATSHDQLRKELDGVRKELCIEREIRMEKSDKVHELELDNQRLKMTLERTGSFDALLAERDLLESDLHALELDKQKLELELGWADPRESEELMKKLSLEKEQLEERLNALVLADSGLVDTERDQLESLLDTLRVDKETLLMELKGSKEKGEMLIQERERLEETVQVLRGEKQKALLALERTKTEGAIVETERAGALLEREQYKMEAEGLQIRLDGLECYEQTIDEITGENNKLHRENKMILDRLREYS